jgi:amino acid adenylation domain-containing protein
MLRGALGCAVGKNVEQVEIDFAPGIPMDRVISAWSATIDATTALRTGFVWVDGGPEGLVAVTVDSPLQVETNHPECWRSWLADDRLNPLPIDGGLPWRAVFWPGAGKLIWTFHHALLDGSSITKILSGFQARLGGAKELEALKLTDLSLPGPGDIAAAGVFHREAFAMLDNCQPEFPGDGEDLPTQRCRCLGSELVTRLESAAGILEVTAATLVTWAWGQAVAAASGANAIAVGQVRSGPPQPGRAGFSMTTVPLVIQRTQSGPLRPVMGDFRKHLLAMRAIENVAVDQLPAGIFDETGGPWPGGVIMVARGTLHHQVGKSASIESIQVDEISGEPLLASAWIHPDLRLEVEVDGSTHGARAAESLLDHWAEIVTAIAEDRSTDAAGITALPVAMQDSQSQWESGGEAAASLHLAQAWRAAADAFATRCAIWTPDKAITFAELDAQVEHLAACLHEVGVKPGQTVASLLMVRENLSVVVLALARLGGIHVPLDPALPESRLRAIIDDAGPVLLLSDSPDSHVDFQLPRVAVSGSIGKTCAAGIPGDPRDTLCILYTSGSTGIPKGVMMPHGGVTNEVFGIARLCGIGPGSRVLQFASPGFDVSVEEVLATLLNGATLIPRPEEISADLRRFQTFIRETEITVLDLPTAFWAAWCAWMVSENETIPRTIETTLIGGERASSAALNDWFSSDGRKHLLVNSYGPTEASIAGTAELIGHDWNESGDPSIGIPLPGVLARISDSQGRRLPHGAAGELWLGGICVGAGYWNRPDLTATAFQDLDGRRWYRTGDRVWRDDSGKLRFLGRLDGQLKIRGLRIEPNEIIRVLESFPGVSAAHAGPVPGHDGTTVLAAWIRWKSTPGDGWPGLLAKHAATRLQAAAIPTRWALVEDFKLTERGKLDLRHLPEPGLTSCSDPLSAPPVTATEKRLAGLWSAVLGIAEIGRDESFFELGGHSLAALRLFAGISREWKIRIPMATLVRAPSLRLLGGVVDREAGGHGSARQVRPMVVPIKPDGHLPPLFCMHGGDGGVLFYRGLAEHLSSGRPLLAIESPALASEGEVRCVPVEETAASYLAAMRECQKVGPYHLAGYSYGGLLVFEIARQLLSAGESVAFAGLVDTINPAITLRRYPLLERGRVFWRSRKQTGVFARLGNLVVRAQEGVVTCLRVRNETRSARNAGITQPHTGLRMLQVRDAHCRSAQLFRPGHLDSHVILFKSRETDDKFDIPDDYGWTEVVRSLDIAEVDGEHLEIFSKQHVASIAGEINRRLDEGDTGEIA